MLIEPLPDSVDALHVLFKQLRDQHATALEKIQALTEQNDKLWHLVKRLQNAQFPTRPSSGSPRSMLSKIGSEGRAPSNAALCGSRNPSRSSKA
jgi:hypothetical protein